MSGQDVGSTRSRRPVLVALLLAALLCAAVLSYFASGSPDGLEAVAERFGFDESASDPAWRHSPFVDYEGVAGLPAGLVRVLGTLVVLAVTAGLVKLARR